MSHLPSPKSLLPIAIATIISASPTTLAQSILLEEVMVTAQKREQNMQDVGISITAYTGEQLEELGFTKSSDIARFTPGVHVGGNLAGQNLQFTIRGVAQNDFNDQTESPVAVYIDDTYVAMAQGQRFAMYDLDRVEVLKGPQGTLFGRNATGGLVHFVSRRPTEELDGFMKAEYGDYDRIKLEGAVGGPITDGISGRLSGYYHEQDGYLDNSYDPANPQSFLPSELALSQGTGDDFGGEENSAVRAQLLFDLGDTASLWLSANWADSTLATSPYQSEATAPVLDAQGRQRNAIFQPKDSTAQGFAFETGAPIETGIFGPFPRPIPGSDATGYIDRDGNGLDYTEGDFSFDDLNTMETVGLSAKFDWQIGDMDFVSITDYKDFEKFMGMDVDSAPMNQLSVWFDANVDQFSQEFRLSGSTDTLHWVGGLYYLDVNYDNNIGFKVLDNGQFLLPPGTLPADYPAHVEQETENISVFGQFDMDLSDKLTLTMGLRVMQEDKDYFYDLQVRGLTSAKDYANGPLFGTFSDVVGLPVSTKFKDDTSDSLWTGKIQLDYRPSDDVLLYAGINRGVKAGGFNAPIDFGGAQLTPGGYSYDYDEEILLSYEVGFKSTMMNGMMRLNGSLYYYDYQDYQGFVFAGVSGNVVNYDSTVVGGEIELITSPIDGLDIILAGSYIDAEVEDVEVAPGIFENTEPSYVPPLQLSGLVRYAWPMGDAEMAVQADASYSDNAFYTLRNYDSHEMDDYTLVNARISYATGGDNNWEFAAFVNNLTDEENEVMGFDISLFCGCSEIAVGEPRWWGLSARKNF
ncbi:MAG: TonB-dependent receptor [Proteobacteria bacterium]|nr:TonB-dependent receptor [Pseudomonadota bacterium]